jgi:tetratricopeptide (TPR) repeat protein
MPYRKRSRDPGSEPAQAASGPPPAGQAPAPALELGRPPRSNLAVEIGVYLLALGTPLAFGTVHPPAVLGMLAAALLAMGGLLWTTRRRRSAIKLFPAGVLLLGAAGVCLLQVLPLPPWLLGLLSPSAAALGARVLADSPLADGWRPLSLAPPETWLELAKYLAYALGFLCAANYYTDRARARRLLKAVAWSGFLVALVGFVHKLVLAESILGIHPLPRETFFFSTFINPNHLAGLLGLCSPVALGLALSARERQDRALYGFLGVITGVGVFMSLSRGGMLAYGVGLGFLVLWGAVRGARRLRRVALAQALGALVLALAGSLAYDTIMRELRTLGDLEALREETKIRAWGAAVELMADFPILGVGRGAFATAYPLAKELPAQVTFTHAENLAVQVGLEWGPVLGLAYLTGLLVVFGLGLRRARASYSMAGALTGFLVVLLHNGVDFNLETGGVMMPLVLLLAVLAAGPFSHAGAPAGWETRPRLGRRPAWALVGLSGLLGLAAAGQALRHGLPESTARLLAHQDAPPAAPCDASPLGQAACQLMDSHPTDFLPHLVLGRAALRARPPDALAALRHLNRALLLNPTHAATHTLAGRALWLAGHREQALLEYRLAVRYGGPVKDAVAETLGLGRDPSLSVRAIPDEPVPLLQAAGLLRARGHTRAAAEAARRAFELNSTSLPALDILGELALAEGRAAEAEALARQGLQVDPQHAEGHELLARALLAQGLEARADQALEEGLAQIPDSVLLASRLVERLLLQKEHRKAEALVDRMATFAPTDDRSQARLHLLVGRIKEARGMFFEARQAFRLAAEASPGDPGVLYRLARVEERMGGYDEAERLYGLLIGMGHRPEEMRARLQVIVEARKLERDGSMWNTWIKSGGRPGAP